MKNKRLEQLIGGFSLYTQLIQGDVNRKNRSNTNLSDEQIAVQAVSGILGNMTDVQLVEYTISGYLRELIGILDNESELDFTYNTIGNLSKCLSRLFELQKKGVYDDMPISNKRSVGATMAAYLIALAINEHDANIVPVRHLKTNNKILLSDVFEVFLEVKRIRISIWEPCILAANSYISGVDENELVLDAHRIAILYRTLTNIDIEAMGFESIIPD